MWPLLLARLAGSPWLRWIAFGILALLAAWFVMRGMNERAARIAELSSMLEAVEHNADAQTRMAESLARTSRDRDSLIDLLRRGEG